jgi:hypothetical protein
MGLFTGIFSGGAKGLLDGAGDIIGKFVEDPNKKAELTQQLAQLNTQHIEAMEKLAEQQYESSLKDAQDARNRETQIATSAQAPLINKIASPGIAAFVTFGFFGLLFYMLKYDVPPANKDVLNIMLGSLGTAWITIVSYYFGSSSGSAEKNEQIKSLTDKLAS